MRKSYTYYFNKEPISRKELLEKLKQDCQKPIHTDYVGNIGISLMDLDEKRYRENIRNIDNGTVVYFMGSKNKYERRARR